MFKRIDFSSWETLLFAAFLVTFAAFVYFTWRALKMKKSEREHMSHLPLETESDDSSPESR